MNLIYLHIGDYSQATARLSPEQDGIYLRLLMEYYKTEKPPVDDLDKLAFLMGCSTKKYRADLQFVLELFFVHAPTKKCWLHKRVEKEIAGYKVDGVQKRYAILCRHWRNVNPGEKTPTYEEFSASPTRYYDENTKRVRIVTGRKELVLESYGDGSTETPAPNYAPVTSNQEPDTSNQEPGNTPVVPKGTSSLEDLAEAIYQLYPRKEKKKKGVAAIVKALKSGGVTELELTEAVKAYAAAVALWPPEDRQFILHPASWFNGGCWADDRANWQRRARPENQRPPQKKGGGAPPDPMPAPAMPEQHAEPEGWREIWAELYPFPAPESWRRVPNSNRDDVLAALRKKKGGAAES